MFCTSNPCLLFGLEIKVVVPAQQTHRQEKWHRSKADEARRAAAERPPSRPRGAIYGNRSSGSGRLGESTTVWPGQTDSDTTLHYALGTARTGTRPHLEVGTNLWRDFRPVSRRGY